MKLLITWALHPRRALSAARLRWAVSRLAGPKLLRALAECLPEAFFIQVGANDGKMMDPLRTTILRSRWRGLVVEPVPALFAQLQRNYSALADRICPLNTAIAREAGERPFYHLAHIPGLPELPPWAHGLGSFRKDIVLKHATRIQDIERYLVTINVPCLNWEGLCTQHGALQVDLVLTDTEGYDFEIIRQIDLERQRPTLIIYEHHHFDAATRSECIARLKESGYRLFEEGLDTWCLDARGGTPQSSQLLEIWPKCVSRSPYAIEV